MLTRLEKEKIYKYFKNQPELRLAYLFGSQVRGKIRKDSDIDLAVLFEDKDINTFRLLGKYREDLSHLLKKKVDVISLNSSDVSFSYRVLGEGKPVYEKKPGLCSFFILDKIKRYFDLKRTYELYYQSMTERIRKDTFGVTL